MKRRFRAPEPNRPSKVWLMALFVSSCGERFRLGAAPRTGLRSPSMGRATADGGGGPGGCSVRCNYGVTLGCAGQEGRSGARHVNAETVAEDAGRRHSPAGAAAPLRPGRERHRWQDRRHGLVAGGNDPAASGEASEADNHHSGAEWRGGS